MLKWIVGGLLALAAGALVAAALIPRTYYVLTSEPGGPEAPHSPLPWQTDEKEIVPESETDAETLARGIRDHFRRSDLITGEEVEILQTQVSGDRVWIVWRYSPGGPLIGHIYDLPETRAAFGNRPIEELAYTVATDNLSEPAGPNKNSPKTRWAPTGEIVHWLGRPDDLPPDARKP